MTNISKIQIVLCEVLEFSLISETLMIGMMMMMMMCLTTAKIVMIHSIGGPQAKSRL